MNARTDAATGRSRPAAARAAQRRRARLAKAEREQQRSEEKSQRRSRRRSSREPRESRRRFDRERQPERGSSRWSRSSERAGRSRRSRKVRRAPTRPTRRQALRRRAVVLVVFGVVVIAVVVALFTPVLGVRSVGVTGTHVLSADRVRAAAAVADGTPMLQVDTAAVRARVARIPQVASVTVSRSWPWTVDVAVTERVAVAVFGADDGLWLVDGTGYAYQKVNAVPKGLPTIDLPRVSATDPVTKAVVGALKAMPVTLRARIKTVTVSPGGDVEFTLANGKQVIWGTAAQSKRKAAVLAVLLTRKGDVYDVSAPSLPGVK